MERKPLVSILIPAYNRPHYLKLALESAIHQTYPNIEIIICDDSTDMGVWVMMQPYLAQYPNIKYVKNDTVLFVKNWNKCYELSSGEYVNYLMDDDLFHPEKIERMMACYLEIPDVALVTSYRQLIDGSGNERSAVYATRRLYNETTVLNGIDFGDDILSDGHNVIGEPTTVLFRKRDLKEPFGILCGRQFTTLNDLATWLSLLVRGNAVYLPEPLSYFRIHFGQNQSTLGISSFADWSELTICAREVGFLQDSDRYKAALELQLNRLAEDKLSPSFSEYVPKINEQQKKIEAIISNL
ncbi:glycosyltransferase family 2 protein [Paenibacillus sp. LjRoot153]|uniref:glycosyltransferase family 2 protein n=1 Tax=Paenibacillus sp. LjRoot153 TaxID=3342270 RepID=UPI003ECF600A